MTTDTSKATGRPWYEKTARRESLAALVAERDALREALAALVNADDSPLNDFTHSDACSCQDYRNFVPAPSDEQPWCRHTAARAALGEGVTA